MITKCLNNKYSLRHEHILNVILYQIRVIICYANGFQYKTYGHGIFAKEIHKSGHDLYIGSEKLQPI